MQSGRRNNAVGHIGNGILVDLPNGDGNCQIVGVASPWRIGTTTRLGFGSLSTARIRWSRSIALLPLVHLGLLEITALARPNTKRARVYLPQPPSLDDLPWQVTPHFLTSFANICLGNLDFQICT